jgi:hypothetical protein
MSLQQIREFRLGGPRGDGINPYLTDDGAFFGDATPLLEKDALGRWRPRPQRALERVLSKSYGIVIDLDWRMTNLASVARALNRSDRCLAAIALVHAELPAAPDRDTAKRMAKAEGRFEKDGHDVSNEPRIPKGETGGGRWTDGSEGGALAATAEATVEISAAGKAMARFLAGLGRSALVELTAMGASTSGVLTLAAGLVLIPIQHFDVSEGALPDNPDIKYRYDEGELSIWQEDAQGHRTNLFSGFADSDGLYRSADGTILGRNLGESVALNGPGIEAAASAASSVAIDERTALGEVPDTPECKEEWERAERECAPLLTGKTYGEGAYRGSAKDYLQCLRGMVTEACGGSPVARKSLSLNEARPS